MVEYQTPKLEVLGLNPTEGSGCILKQDSLTPHSMAECPGSNSSVQT